MKYNELPNMCRVCNNLQIFSLFMDNNHDYICTKNLIEKVRKEHKCPKLLLDDETGETE